MQARIVTACSKGFRNLKAGAQKHLTGAPVGNMSGNLAMAPVLPIAHIAGVSRQVAAVALHAKIGLQHPGRLAPGFIQMSPAVALGCHLEALSGRDGNVGDLLRTGQNQATRVHFKAVDSSRLLELESGPFSGLRVSRMLSGASLLPRGVSAYFGSGGSGGEISRSFTAAATETNVQAPISESLSASSAESGGELTEDDGGKKEKAAVVSKQGLVERLAKSMGHSKAQAANWLNAILVEITEGVKNNERIHLKGFGTLESVERTFRVPAGLLKKDQTPPPVSADRTVTSIRPTFSAGKPLIAFINDPAAKDGTDDGSSLLADPKRASKKASDNKTVVGIDALAERLGSRMDHTPEQAGKWVGTTIKELAKAVAKGEKVQLTGFGSFERKEREYKIPSKDGAPTPTVTKARPGFSAGKAFVALLNDPNAKSVAPSVHKKVLEEKDAKESSEVKDTKKKSAAKK